MGQVGRPEKPEEERRKCLPFPVAPETKAIFQRASEQLGKKSPGWLIDDMAKALEKILEGR